MLLRRFPVWGALLCGAWHASLSCHGKRLRFDLVLNLRE